jgi:hypothetical protein
MMISPEHVSESFQGSDVVEQLKVVQREVWHFPK